jgi:hypothetical protein
MTEIPADLIDVRPEFAAALGMQVEEIKAMGLRELINRAYDLGYDINVSSKRALSGEGHLTLSCDSPSPPDLVLKE